MSDLEKPDESKPEPGVPSAATEAAPAAPSRTAFFWRHRVLLMRLLGLALIVIFVLQNSEPTTIDFLFWSLPTAPKLVLILTGMVLGALVWEILRRLIGLGGRKPA